MGIEGEKKKYAKSFILSGRTVVIYSWWFSWKRICLQYRRPGFDPWAGKMPWRRECQPSILTWRIPLTEESGCLQFIRSQRNRCNWATNHTHTHTHTLTHSWWWERDTHTHTLTHSLLMVRERYTHTHVLICLLKNLNKSRKRRYRYISTENTH